MEEVEKPSVFLHISDFLCMLQMKRRLHQLLALRCYSDPLKCEKLTYVGYLYSDDIKPKCSMI